MTVRYLFFIFCLLVGGCQNKPREKEIAHKFVDIKIPETLTEKGSSYKLSSIADSVKEIILETTAASLIDEIKDIQFVGTKVFLLTDNKSIFVFNGNGKFLNPIGKKGRGPSEYYSVIDYAVSADYVFILDYGSRVAKYNHKGDFIDYIALPKQASRILLTPKKTMLFFIPDSQFNNDDEIYSWLEIDNNGTMINEVAPLLQRNLDSKSQLISNHYALTNFSSVYPLSFKEAFNDTLYYFQYPQLVPSPFCFLDLGIHKIDFQKSFDEVVQAKHNMRINKIIDLPHVMFIFHVCNCVDNRKTQLAVYNKIEETFSLLKDKNGNQYLENDISGLNFKPLTIRDNQLIGYIHAYEYLNNKANDALPRMTVNDNPILIIANLKPVEK